MRVVLPPVFLGARRVLDVAVAALGIRLMTRLVQEFGAESDAEADVILGLSSI